MIFSICPVVPKGIISSPESRAFLVCVLFLLTWIPSDACSSDLFTSKNYGSAEWEVIALGMTDSDIYQITVDPFSPLNIFATSTCSVYRSTDGGRSWRAVLVLDTSECFSRGESHHKRQSYQDSNDKTDQLRSKMSDLRDQLYDDLVIELGEWADYEIYEILEAMESDIEEQAIKELRLEGWSWSEPEEPEALSTESESNNSRSSGIHQIVIDSLSSQVVYAATSRGLYRSEDGGSYWSLIFQGDRGRGVLTVAVLHPLTGPSVLLIGTEDGVYRSVDFGVFWQQTGPGSDSRKVDFLVSAAVIEERVFAIVGEALFISNDSGRTWFELRLPSLGSRMKPSVVLPDSRDPNSLYLATSVGVLFSNTAGVTWEHMGGTVLNVTGLVHLMSGDLIISTPEYLYRLNGGSKISEQVKVSFGGLNLRHIVLKSGTSEKFWLASDRGVVLLSSPSVMGTCNSEEQSSENSKVSVQEELFSERTVGEWVRAGLDFNGLSELPEKRCSASLLPTLSVNGVFRRDWSLSKAQSHWEVGVGLAWDLPVASLSGSCSEERVSGLRELRGEMAVQIINLYFLRSTLQRDFSLVSGSLFDEVLIRLRIDEVSALLNGYVGQF